MQSGEIVSLEWETTQLLSTLKRFDDDTFKILKKELGTLGAEAKRRLVAVTPVRSGNMRGAWQRRTTVNNSKIDISVTIKWPPATGKKAKSGPMAGKVVRYPFVLEHGRAAGVSASGRTITAMAPRKYIANVRTSLIPRRDETLRRVHDEAITAFER